MSYHWFFEGSSVSREQEDVGHDHDGRCEAEAGHVGAHAVPVEDDDRRQRRDEEPRDHLEADEEPAVGGHLHEEVLLVAVDLVHALKWR